MRVAVGGDEVADRLEVLGAEVPGLLAEPARAVEDRPADRGLAHVIIAGRRAGRPEPPRDQTRPVDRLGGEQVERVDDPLVEVVVQVGPGQQVGRRRGAAEQDRHGDEEEPGQSRREAHRACSPEAVVSGGSPRT
jgi:hypothetical protein